MLKFDKATHLVNTDFMALRSYSLVTSSSKFARSNDLLEHHIQTMKNQLLKMLYEGRTLCDWLAATRSTPVYKLLPWPVLLSQSRNFVAPCNFWLQPSVSGSSGVPVYSAVAAETNKSVVLGRTISKCLRFSLFGLPVILRGAVQHLAIRRSHSALSKPRSYLVKC